MAFPSGFHLRLAWSGEGALLRCWTGTVAENSSAFRETAEGIEDQLARGAAAIVFAGDAAVGAGRRWRMRRTRVAMPGRSWA